MAAKNAPFEKIGVAEGFSKKISVRIKVSQKNSVSLKRSQKEKTRIWDVHQLKLSMKRTIFKNFCEF